MQYVTHADPVVLLAILLRTHRGRVLRIERAERSQAARNRGDDEWAKWDQRIFFWFKIFFISRRLRAFVLYTSWRSVFPHHRGTLRFIYSMKSLVGRLLTGIQRHVRHVETLVLTGDHVPLPCNCHQKQCCQLAGWRRAALSARLSLGIECR